MVAVAPTPAPAQLVVIDQRTAFVGGLDLALGRFDTPSHPLRDDDERDDTCACCGGTTLTAAGLAMDEVLVCDNRQCEAEVHL